MKKITILMAAIALVCFSVPAMAVDWNFYGSARMATFYVSNDYKSTPPAGSNSDKLSELQWDFQGNSRVGANVKAEHLKARFEFGVNEASVSSRRLYGVWSFGAGELKVGKDYTPISQFISGQVFDADLGLLGVGTVYGSRVGQVALKFGGFDIALISPATGQLDGTTAQGSTDGTVQRVIPKIEASWGMSFDAFDFGVQGGYNYYKLKDVASAKNPGDTNDMSVDSWTVGANAGFNFGPGYVKAAASYGRNIGSANWSLPGNRNQGAYAGWNGDDSTENVYTFQGALVAGLKVSDMLTFEAGFGYRMDDPDSNYPEGNDKSKPWAAYGQAVVALAPGVYIIPEVGYFKGDQNYAGNTATNTLYAGAKWQIDF